MFKQWSISWILIGLNLNKSEFSFLNFIYENKVHFRHQREIFRKLQFLKMLDLEILLDCEHPTLPS
jgi:hypothetical protein